MKFLSGLTLVFWILSNLNFLSAQNDDSDVRLLVENFDMNSGLAANITTPMVEDYLEIIGAQQKKITGIKTKFSTLGKKIKSDEAMSFAQKLKQLKAARERQNKLVEDILMPHQKKRLKSFGVYLVVTKEGLANSIANGAIAQSLELTNTERREFRDKSKTILDEYRTTVLKAQRKAIAKLRGSLPAEKQKKLKVLLEPMLHSDGTFWRPLTFMLEVSKSRMTYSFPTLPPIK